MKPLVACLVLAACGPSVQFDDDDQHGSETTTASQTTNASQTTTATSATSSPTSMTTTVSTTMSGEATGDPTSDGTDDGEDDIDESDSFTFIEDPDFGSCTCECDVWAQDCPKGDKCMPWANDGGDSWNATRCSPIDPAPGGVGDPCTVEGSPLSGIDDCDIDMICWDVDPVSLEGECVANCEGSEANPMCADGFGCVIAFEGTVISCLPLCDPLAPKCAGDEACVHAQVYLSSGYFTCLPTPPFSTALAYGEACDSSSFQRCGVGLACVAPEHVPGCEGYGCCTSIGVLSQMPTCPEAPQTCIPFDDTMPDEDLCFCGVAA